MDHDESKPESGRTLFDGEPSAPSPRRAPEPETDDEPDLPDVSSIETPEASSEPVAGSGKWTDLPDGGFGPVLGEARRRGGFTLEKVADLTQIQKRHLVALESENYSDLPEVVYIIAYVRKLARLYGLPQEVSDEITSELRQNLNREPPEDVTKIGFESEENEENTRRVRQLLTGLIIAAAAIAILLIGSVAFLLSRSGGATPRTVFDESKLLELQPQPVLRVRPLEVPR